jgi:hypothetical protein
MLHYPGAAKVLFVCLCVCVCVRACARAHVCIHQSIILITCNMNHNAKFNLKQSARNKRKYDFQCTQMAVCFCVYLWFQSDEHCHDIIIVCTSSVIWRNVCDILQIYYSRISMMWFMALAVLRSTVKYLFWAYVCFNITTNISVATLNFE